MEKRPSVSLRGWVLPREVGVGGQAVEGGGLQAGRALGEVEFEVAAEVGGEGVAKLGGDDFDGVAGGEEFGGFGHAFAVEAVARGAAEVVVAEAFELTQGDAECLGGAGDIPVGALREVTPEFGRGWAEAVEAMAGHRFWLSPFPPPTLRSHSPMIPSLEAMRGCLWKSGGLPSLPMPDKRCRVIT